MEPDGQSLAVSHLIPRTTAAAPVGSDETTKTVNAARTTIRSGLVIDCLPLTTPGAPNARIRRPTGSESVYRKGPKRGISESCGTPGRCAQPSATPQARPISPDSPRLKEARDSDAIAPSPPVGGGGYTADPVLDS